MPVASKPTTPVWAPASPFATARSHVSFCETDGAPIELRTGTHPTATTGGLGVNTGPYPRILANDFAGGPGRYWPYSGKMLTFPLCGFLTAGLAAQRTYAVTFQLNFNPTGWSSDILIPLVTTGNIDAGANHQGIALSAGANGFSLVTQRSFNAVSAKVFTSPLLQFDRIYTVALSILNTGGVTRRYQAWDHQADALHATAVEQNDAGAIAESSSSALYLSPGNAAGNLAWPFRGRMYSVLLDDQPWDATTFATWAADPWAVARGTYTPSGGLTAGQGGLYHSEDNVCRVSFARATGTGTGGTGSPTYYLHKSTDIGFTPTAGTRLTTLTPLPAGNLAYNDAAVVHGGYYAYRLEVVDGSSTVWVPASNTAAPIILAPRKPGVHILAIGDSNYEGVNGTPVKVIAQRAHHISNRPISVVNRSYATQPARMFSPGVTHRTSYAYSGAAATTGSFLMQASVNGGSASSSFSVPYNATAQQVQDAVNAVAAVATAGGVACTGGPLNVAPVVLTSNLPNQIGAFIAGAGTADATPVATTIWTGAAKQTSPAFYDNLVAEIADIEADLPRVVAIYQMGTNDANTDVQPVDHGRHVKATADGLIAAGLDAFAARDPSFIGPAVSSAAKLARQAGYEGQLDAIHNGTTIFHLKPRFKRTMLNEPRGASDGLHYDGFANEIMAVGDAYGLLPVLFPDEFSDGPAAGGVTFSPLGGGLVR